MNNRINQPLTTKLLVATTALWLGSSCAMIDSDEVDQEEIRTTYEAEYQMGSSRDSVDYTAKFKTGQSVYVRLVGGSTVSLDGRSMKERGAVLGNVHYELSEEARDTHTLWRRHRFSYVNNDGEVFENSFHLPDPVEIEIPPGATIIRGETTRLDWSARSSVLSSEDLKILILQPSSGQIERLYASGSGYSGVVTIQPENLVAFSDGRLKIRICREVEEIASASPAAGGELILRTCSVDHEIDLVESRRASIQFTGVRRSSTPGD